MTGPQTPAAEVLRGMHIEPVPLRLARRRPQQEQGPGAELPEPAEAQALREGYEEGLRQGRSEGWSAGHEEGLRQGQEEAAQRARALLEQEIAQALAPLQQEQARCRQLAAALGAVMDDGLAAAEDEMVALCFETLCRVLGATALQPQTVREQIDHLLRTRRQEGALALHLHPQDLALLEGGQAGGEDRPAPATVRYVADPQVALGGCIAVGTSGSLDLRLETLLVTLKDALLQARAANALAAKAQS